MKPWYSIAKMCDQIRTDVINKIKNFEKCKSVKDCINKNTLLNENTNDIINSFYCCCKCNRLQKALDEEDKVLDGWQFSSFIYYYVNEFPIPDYDIMTKIIRKENIKYSRAYSTFIHKNLLELYNNLYDYLKARSIILRFLDMSINFRGRKNDSILITSYMTRILRIFMEHNNATKEQLSKIMIWATELYDEYENSDYDD